MQGGAVSCSCQATPFRQSVCRVSEMRLRHSLIWSVDTVAHRSCWVLARVLASQAQARHSSQLTSDRCTDALMHRVPTRGILDPCANSARRRTAPPARGFQLAQTPGTGQIPSRNKRQTAAAKKRGSPRRRPDTCPSPAAAHFSLRDSSPPGPQRPHSERGPRWTDKAIR